ncbi:hypothetical protein GQ457_12G015650 [Hibiscus cannabinus]
MTVVELWGGFGAVGSHECKAFNAHLHKGFKTLPKGKSIWEVRTRNWKLREGENRLSRLLEGISIASLGKARRQGGSSITFVQVWFL